MNDKALNLEEEYYHQKIKRVIIFGFFLRIFTLLLIVFVLSEWVDPYFISDDIQYEKIVKLYLNNASSVVDVNAFSYIGASGYLKVFWPWVLCISAYIFKTIYAGRFVNIILSTIAIGVVYKLTEAITENKMTAIKAGKLFAYLPITILTCCFPIKDIFLTLATLCVFLLFVKFEKGEHISSWFLIVDIFLCIGIYYTRGAVLELLVLFFLIYILKRYWNQHNYIVMILCFFVGVAVVYLLKNEIFDAFQTKVNDYSDYGNRNTTISSIRIDSISQIYKLPFAYFFATLQPMTTNIFDFSNQKGFWLSIISVLNISIYPIAMGNFLYIFKRKKDYLFWFTSGLMFVAVISLSLGVFRHYLFLLPVELINYSIETFGQSKVCRQIIRFGTVVLISIIFVYSCLQGL